jgi:hypothetical protein
MLSTPKTLYQYTPKRLQELLLKLKTKAEGLNRKPTDVMRNEFKRPERMDQTFNSMGGFR